MIQPHEKLKTVYTEQEINESLKRFFENTEVKGENECWLWKGKTITNQNGFIYGYIYFQGESLKAHIYSYLMFNGFLKRGKLICHKCNISLCVNPKHLYKGTHSSNMLDMAIAGTNKTTKRILPQETVVEIRRLFTSGELTNSAEMAEKFGITQPYAWRLMNRKRRPR